MADDNTDDGRIGLFGYVRHHYNGMAIWRRLLVTLSIVAVLVGAGGMVVGRVQPNPMATAANTDVPAKIEDIKKEGMTKGWSSEQIRTKVESVKTDAAVQARWFYDNFSPTLAKMGASFFAAFVLGYAFRQFVKTMATIAALAIAAALILQFTGMADVAAMIRGGADKTQQLADQLYEIGKKMVTERLPASGSGIAGLVVGFLRKK
ncbi:MAG: hypothetical protein QM770_05820 [Tepidisphaeraceae bacterium]